jgi:hypothetical protein
MIVVLTVMSNMDLSHDKLGLWLGWFWLGLSGSSWFGSWYEAGVKPVCMVLGLATGGMPVSSVGFSYSWVNEVQCHA